VKTRTERLEKLAERKRRLGQQIDRMRAAVAQEERKQDARRKILAGSMAIAQAQRSEEARQRLLAELDGYLTRDHDRALFGLGPLHSGADAAGKGEDGTPSRKC
jgi:cell division septum initiation protein DivIVA